MRKVVFFILLWLPVFAYTQSVYPIRADSVRIYKQGGYAELIIENRTKDSTGGTLTNTGNGRTAFIRARVINDSTFIVGLDTLVLRGASGPGGSGTTETLTNVGGGNGVVKPLSGSNYDIKTFIDGYLIKWTVGTNTLQPYFDSANAPKTVIKDSTGIGLRYGAPSVAGGDDTVVIYNTGTGADSSIFATRTYIERYGRDFVDAITGQFWIVDLNDLSRSTITSNKLEAYNDLGTGNNDINNPTSGTRPSFYYSGGPNNRPYVEVESGKTFGITSPSTTTGPFTFYVLCQLPDLPDNQRVFTYSGGSSGPLVNDGIGMRVYTGALFGTANRPAARTEWMLLKVILKDADGLGIGVNNEPMIYADGGSSTAITISELLFDNYPGIKISEVRGFTKLLSEYEDWRLTEYFFVKYKLQNRYKTIIGLGDSHLYGTMSGTTVTGGPYITRLQDSTFWRVYNFAISGSVVDPFSNPALLATSLKALYPSYNETKYRDLYFHFQYGTNDAANEGSASIVWATWKARYKAYIQSFLDIGVPKSNISISTPPYSTAAYPAGNLPDAVTPIREIAEELGIVLIDFYQDMQDDGLDIDDVVGGDDIHGDAAIHQSMFESMRDALEAIVETTGGGGGSGVTTMAAFGSSPNANGATISGNTLTLQPASLTHPGGVTTGTQTFGGEKTFDGSLATFGLFQAFGTGGTSNGIRITATADNSYANISLVNDFGTGHASQIFYRGSATGAPHELGIYGGRVETAVKFYNAAGDLLYISAAGNLLSPASAYHNYGTTIGSSGYGFRDNAGTMQYKNSGGSWTAFSSGSSETPAYATYSLVTDKTFSGSGAAEVITLDNEDIESGITHTGTSEEITIVHNGIYSIATDISVTSSATDAVKWCVQKWDGVSAWVNVSNTASMVSVAVTSFTYSGSQNYQIPLVTGDKIRFVATTSSTNASLNAIAAADGVAAIPAFRVRITKVAPYNP